MIRYVPVTIRELRRMHIPLHEKYTMSPSNGWLRIKFIGAFRVELTQEQSRELYVQSTTWAGNIGNSLGYSRQFILKRRG